MIKAKSERMCREEPAERSGSLCRRQTCFAILCGSAPEGYRQKKLADRYDFLTSSAGGAVPGKHISIFPCGVNELVLEGVLNGVFAAAAEADGETGAGEVLLYFCALTERDVRAELSDSAIPGVEVVRLGSDEVRKDVIAYYAELAEKLEIGFRVVYAADSELVSESALGYEKVS